MAMKILFLFCSSALLLACAKKETPKQPTEEIVSVQEQKELSVTHSLRTYELLNSRIGTTFDHFALDKEYLYGKFFHDRAEFYIIAHPNLYLSGSEVEELTLYFVDGTLCKKKYQLSEDISSDLIRMYGNFKFRPLSLDDQQLAANQIVRHANGLPHLNERLKRFQLRWTRDDLAIHYTLKKDTLQATILLEEELPDYRHILLAAEIGL